MGREPVSTLLSRGAWRTHLPRPSPLSWLGPALGPVCPRHLEKRARYKYFLIMFIYLLTECCPNEEVVFLRAGPGLSRLLMNHQFQEKMALPTPPYSHPHSRACVGPRAPKFGSCVLSGPGWAFSCPLSSAHPLPCLGCCCLMQSPGWACLPGIDSGAPAPSPCWVHRLPARPRARSQCQSLGRDQCRALIPSWTSNVPEGWA